MNANHLPGAQERLTRELEERVAQLERVTRELQAENATLKRAETLLNGQRQVLEGIATGVALPETLAALVRLIEAQAPGMLGSILLLDDDGLHVRHGAAPSLPAEYVSRIDGEPIGPTAGSCGTAAYRKEAVFVADIAIDPLWADYRARALPHGLRACWSAPILDAQRQVLGTFAMYYPHPGVPQPEHLRLIDLATHVAAIAIGRRRADDALRASEERNRRLVENFPHCIVSTLDRDWVVTFMAGNELQALNLTPAAFIGRRLTEILSPAQFSAAEPPLKAAFAGAVVSYEITYAPGATFLVNAAPLRDADGVIRQVITTSLNITERKQAQDQVQRQLAELRQMYDVMLGREGRVGELKGEVNELLRQHGAPPRYPGQGTP